MDIHVVKLDGLLGSGNVKRESKLFQKSIYQQSLPLETPATGRNIQSQLDKLNF
jgi:hypothetical protein